jgi:uncharacterized membrane protein
MQRAGLTVAGAFFALSVILSGVLPLWLDEIIQLRETRGTSPAQLIHSLPNQPGAAPLGYLIQQTAMRLTGYSVRWARFPSALFVAGAVWIVALLGTDFGLKKAWGSAALFAILPVTLRYGCESRVYSQALLFSTLATFLFVRLMKNPGWLFGVLYCLTLIAAVFTQPYAVFVGVAHLLVAPGKVRGYAVAGVALAGVAFLPWYLWAKSIWAAGVAGAGLHFVLSAKTPLMLFREVAGAGYWGSGLLLILCWLAFTRRGQPDRIGETPGLVLLGSLIVVPALLALAADATFGYFVATRQILWVVPAIAILAAMGIDRSPRIGLPVVAVLAAFCLWQGFRDFTAPRENWDIAATAIADEVRQGACLEVVPAEQRYSYEFFRPELSQSRCPAPHVTVAITPYATPGKREAALAALTAQGYTRQSTTMRGKTEIILLSH